jgi:hypothetical protein
MKLLTHNMLMSPGTRAGYPLAIVDVEKMEVSETEFNAEFTARMVEKLDYAVLLKTLSSVRAAAARGHALKMIARASTHRLRAPCLPPSSARSGHGVACRGACSVRGGRALPAGAAPRDHGGRDH